MRHASRGRERSHTILDLVPDRDAQTAAAWMKQHPESELVSRDRGEEYAAAARLGAPQAMQCADRFHLAQHSTEIVEVLTWLGMLNGRIALTNGLNCAKPGSPIRESARRLGMGERTVCDFLTRGIPSGKPELRHKRHRRGFDRYADYVAQRWKQGERNGLQLWRELQAASDTRDRGEPCSDSSLCCGKAPLPLEERLSEHKLFQRLRGRECSAKETVWLCVRP